MTTHNSKPSETLPELTVVRGTGSDRQRWIDRFLYSKLPKATTIPDHEVFQKDAENTQVPIRVLEPRDQAKHGVLYFIRCATVDLYSQMQTKINVVYSRVDGFPEAILPKSDIKMNQIAVSLIPKSLLTGEAHYERVKILKDYSETSEKQTIACKLIDSGDEVDLNVNTFYHLLEAFAELPPKIYKFQLEHLGYYKHSILVWTFISRMKLEQNPNLTVEFVNNEPEEYAQGILRDSRKPWDISINEQLLALILKTHKDCIQVDEENSLIRGLQVTFVTQNAEAFVRNRQNNVFKHLRYILKNISKEKTQELKPEDLSEAQMYLLRDHKKRFQRVRIILPITAKGARVYFIDFGTESNDIISAEKLILATGLETQFPNQCMKIKLNSLTEISEPTYANYSEIRRMYKDDEFNGRVIEKDFSEMVPVTMDLMYTKNKSRATLALQLTNLILIDFGFPNEAANFMANIHGFSSHQNIICQHQHIFPIKWINPKYFEGAELNVSIEKMKDYDNLIVVELKDNGTLKNTIRDQLRVQQENNSVLDFTKATKTMLKETDGMSLFMMAMNENCRTLCRVVPLKLEKPSDISINCPPKKSSTTQFDASHVPVYLLDYAKIEQTQIDKLHVLIPRYFYIHPPMAIRAQLVKQQRRDFEINKLLGTVRKVRIHKVHHYNLSQNATAIETVVEIEII